MQSLNEQKMKIWRELLREFKEPLRDSTRPEQKKDVRVYHPECPYADKRTGIVVESRYIWWLNHPEEEIQCGEIIHHINGNRQDNRIENLVKLPWSGHSRLHQDIRNGTFARMMPSNTSIKPQRRMAKITTTSQKCF